MPTASIQMVVSCVLAILDGRGMVSFVKMNILFCIVLNFDFGFDYHHINRR